VGPVIHSKDPTNCLSEFDREASKIRRALPIEAVAPWGKNVMEV
jgi:hypothetical protein